MAIVTTLEFAMREAAAAADQLGTLTREFNP
jgi:hypothetical protein